MVQKSTTLSTDLPLHHWQGLECNHGSHTKPKEMKSDDLSRHPPPLMKGLAEAIIQTLPKGRLPRRHHKRKASHRVGLIVPHQSPFPKRRPWGMTPSLFSRVKTRPLRDGGGKPSPGRRPPPLRPQSRLTKLGEASGPLAQACAQDVQTSINKLLYFV